MSKFDQNRIKDGSEKLCTNKQTDKQTNGHYKNNGHLAVNQKNDTGNMCTYCFFGLGNDGLFAVRLQL